jgi:hypothetical protein
LGAVGEEPERQRLAGQDLEQEVVTHERSVVEIPDLAIGLRESLLEEAERSLDGQGE